MAVPLVQLTRSAPTRAAGRARPRRRGSPGWLKVKAPGGPELRAPQELMRELGLHTVCEEARCPNIGECWEHKAATFMILGDVCTRNCTYCAVAHGTPDGVRPAGAACAWPRRSSGWGWQHVVITSVDRDDLPERRRRGVRRDASPRSGAGCPRPRSRCWFPTSRAPSARSAS